MKIEDRIENRDGRKVWVQTHQDAKRFRYEVRIRRTRNCERAAEITPFLTGIPHYVPLGMLSLAAGKDEWMRAIEFKCSCCERRMPARLMEAETCQACFEKAGDENERLDRGEA